MTIGFPYPTLSNYAAGRRQTIDVDIISLMVKTYDDVSPRWLLTGEGSMFEKESGSSAIEEKSADAKKKEPIDNELIRKALEQNQKLIDLLLKNQ